MKLLHFKIVSSIILALYWLTLGFLASNFIENTNEAIPPDAGYITMMVVFIGGIVLDLYYELRYPFQREQHYEVRNESKAFAIILPQIMMILLRLMFLSVPTAIAYGICALLSMNFDYEMWSLTIKTLLVIAAFISYFWVKRSRVKTHDYQSTKEDIED